MVVSEGIVCEMQESNCSLSTDIYHLQIVNMIYFLDGRRHDAGMLRDSRLLQSLKVFAFDLHGQQVYIYALSFP